MLIFRHALFAAFVGGALACNLNLDNEGTKTSNDDDDFRPDVFECEDALARLTSCCPNFVATEVACTYFNDATTTNTGCDTTSTHDEEDPAFSQAESECILQSSCAVLVATHVCARAQVATSFVASSATDALDASGDSYTASGSHAAVCP